MRQVLGRFFLLIFLCPGITAVALGAGNVLGERIEALVRDVDPDLSLGVVVESLDPRKPLVYKRNENRYFTPASTVKVLTAVVALKELGADFTYKTEVWRGLSAKRPQDVYLKFSGDPTLTSGDLVELLRKLKAGGVNEIEGNLVYDYSGYELPSVYMGWMTGDVDTCEVSPIYKAIIDENYYHYKLCPGPAVGAKAELVSKENFSLGYPLVNLVRTVGKGLGERREYHFDGDVMKISGKMVLDGGKEKVELPVRDFERFIRDHLTRVLGEAGIVLKGRLVKGGGASGENLGELLGVHESEPLGRLLGPALQRSKNLFFGALLAEVATQKSGTPIQNWKQAGEFLKKSIAKHYRVSFEGAILDDGIGLSRYNLLTAGQMAALLKGIYADKVTAKVLMGSLAQNGGKGTLASRMAKGSLKGRVRAKTGTLSGVSNIAGYVRTRGDRTVLFVIMAGQFVGSKERMRRLEDGIIELIYELG